MGVMRPYAEQPWRVVVVAIAGLLAAVAIAGLVTLVITRNVADLTERTLRYDVELEDRGDDLRVAVLDLRHYHRNLVFAGPSRRGLADFDAAYAALLDEIGGVAELGIEDPLMPDMGQVDRLAREYYGAFRPAIDAFAADSAAFFDASDQGLTRLTRLEQAAETIDTLGEQRASAALRRVEDASVTATVVLVGVIVALGLIGAVLSYAALRVVRELRELYAAQQRTATRLAEALEAKTDFIADASHELRTPLTVLRGNAEVGLQLGAEECPHGEILREIVAESARMSQLVDDLLLLARSDADSLRLEVEPVEVEPWLADVAARAEILARERGARLRTALTARGTARVDARRMEQALLALVDNAAKYGPPGGLIELRTDSDSGELRIEVRDRGPGIPEADLPRIFDRFYRVGKTRTRRQGGTGLGLAIARTIVDAHDGTIEVSSRQGVGTTMTVRLPLVASALEETTAVEPRIVRRAEMRS